MSQLINSSKHSKETSGNDVVQVSFPVKEGDVVIAGTDGIFDNVWLEEMIKVLKHCAQQEGKFEENAAVVLTNLAWKQSQDRHKESPFSAEARKNGMIFYGGKTEIGRASCRERG